MVRRLSIAESWHDETGDVSIVRSDKVIPRVSKQSTQSYADSLLAPPPAVAITLTEFSDMVMTHDLVLRLDNTCVQKVVDRANHGLLRCKA